MKNTPPSASGRPPHSHPAPEGEESSRMLGSCLIFYGSLQALLLAFSVGRVAIVRPLAVCIVLGAAVAAGLYWRLSGKSRARNKFRPGWVTAFAVAGGTVYLALWALAYVLPDFSADGLWYHNPPLHFWALRGYVHRIMLDQSVTWNFNVSGPWNGYPKGVELLGFLIVRATGLVRLLNTVNLFVLPLGILGLISLSRLLGVPRRWALLSGIFFLFIPVNIAQSPTTMVDSGAAAYYIALFAVTVSTCRRIKEGLPALGLFLPLGCALGLAVGAKGTGVILVPAVVIFLLAAFSRGERRLTSTRPRNPFRSFRLAPETFFSRGLFWIAFTMAVAVIVGGYWAIRNYYYTGTPFHPLGLTLGPLQIFPGLCRDTLFYIVPCAPGTENWPQTRRILFCWLGGLNHWRDAATGYTSTYGGLGLLWPAGAFPAIVFLLLRAGRDLLKKYRGTIARCPFRDTAFLMMTAFSAILFFFMPRHHNHMARYTIWLYGLGLPAFAWCAARVWTADSRVRRRWGRVWVAAVIAVAVMEGLYGLRSQFLLLRKFHLEGSSPGLSISRFFRLARRPYPAGYYWPALKDSIMERILQGSETVAISQGSSDPRIQIMGHLTQGTAFGRRQIFILDHETIARDPDWLETFLRGRAVRYVLWDSRLPIPPGIDELAVWRVYQVGDGLWQVFVLDSDQLPVGQKNPLKYSDEDYPVFQVPYRQ